eukprot:CFRG3234T1
MEFHVLITATVPALIMLTATFLGFHASPSRGVMGGLQHFAAGLVLATVSTELVPVMLKAKGVIQMCSVVVGFIMGVAALLLIQAVTPDEEPIECDCDSMVNVVESSGRATPVRPKSPRPLTPFTQTQRRSLLARSISAGSSPHIHVQPQAQPQAQLQNQLQVPVQVQPPTQPPASPPAQPQLQLNTQYPSPVTTGSVERNVRRFGSLPEMHEESSPLLHGVESDLSAPRFPSSLLFAVAVDSMCDGTLLGLASIVSVSTSGMMAISLSVEMGFLGITLSNALRKQPRIKMILAACLGPLILFLCALLGNVVAGFTEHYRSAFYGLISFGASALLFMVAEELLLEAHEGEGRHLWWVDLQLYTGFLTALLSKQILES